MGVDDTSEELPISPQFRGVTKEINANDDAMTEIQMSDEEEEETTETRKVNTIKDPKQPSKEEIEEHNITHVPYRDWCPHCVMGSAPNRHHKKQEKGSYDIPHLVCD